jgi:hypothetical protein
MNTVTDEEIRNVADVIERLRIERGQLAEQIASNCHTTVNEPNGATKLGVAMALNRAKEIDGYCGPDATGDLANISLLAAEVNYLRSVVTQLHADRDAAVALCQMAKQSADMHEESTSKFREQWKLAESCVIRLRESLSALQSDYDRVCHACAGDLYYEYQEKLKALESKSAPPQPWWVTATFDALVSAINGAHLDSDSIKRRDEAKAELRQRCEKGGA